MSQLHYASKRSLLCVIIFLAERPGLEPGHGESVYALAGRCLTTRPPLLDSCGGTNGGRTRTSASTERYAQPVHHGAVVSQARLELAETSV